MLKNILLDGMPDAIVVNGIPFDIYTDYRAWIRVGYLIEDLSRLDKNPEKQYEKFKEISELVIKENPKGIILSDDFIESIVNFYSGYPKAENEYIKAKKNQQKDKNKPPSYDFIYDAGYIYCSFMSFYHIDLHEIEYMHWWKFMILFEGLMMSDQTSVNFVVGTRQQKINSKTPKEEKRRIEKLQKDLALPEKEEYQKAGAKLNDFLANTGKPSGKKE